MYSQIKKLIYVAFENSIFASLIAYVRNINKNSCCYKNAETENIMWELFWLIKIISQIITIYIFSCISEIMNKQNRENFGVKVFINLKTKSVIKIKLWKYRIYFCRLFQIVYKLNYKVITKLSVTFNNNECTLWVMTIRRNSSNRILFDTDLVWMPTMKGFLIRWSSLQRIPITHSDVSTKQFVKLATYLVGCRFNIVPAKRIRLKVISDKRRKLHFRCI